MTVRILQGDCRQVMHSLAEASVDAIVTDPPYHLTNSGGGPHGKGIDNPYSRSRAGAGSTGFMGMAWDGGDVAFRVETWAEALRVLKPGGHLLAFSGTRTYHRMVVAIEDAGFEVRDQLGWVYGSGFPKSLDVSKAIDKAAGAEREVTKPGQTKAAEFAGKFDNACSSTRERRDVPASEAAEEWRGWGTALKPAWEPIVLARKPLRGTVATNVLAHGTGALNIDGCRVGDEVLTQHGRGDSENLAMSGRNYAEPAGREWAGRWPANLLHDGSEEVLAAFPDAPGQQGRITGDEPSSKTADIFGDFAERAPATPRDDGGGSAARFFASFPQEAACSQSSAGTAPASSSLRSVLGASVQSGAAIWPSLAGIVSSDSTTPSTSVTDSESRTLCEAVITAMVPIGSESSRDSRHERPSPCGSRVSVAVLRSLTGTTTITASLCRSDGSVAAATFSITPTPLDLGAQDFARFRYCAKADRADRNEGLNDPGPQFVTGRMPHDAEAVERSKRGNHHPTVKPTDLMRYLCRLVTPPGGLVLDPFMGSGSTLKAAELEGFSAIGIELDPAYIEIAKRRIAADAPLFAEVSAA